MGFDLKGKFNSLAAVEIMRNFFRAVTKMGDGQDPFYDNWEGYVSDKFEINPSVYDIDENDSNYDKESGVYKNFVWKGGKRPFFAEWYKNFPRGWETNRDLSDEEIGDMIVDIADEIKKIMKENGYGKGRL